MTKNQSYPFKTSTKMKLYIRHKDTEVSLDENSAKEPLAVRWSDQNEQLQETIKVIFEQIKKITDSPTNQ